MLVLVVAGLGLIGAACGASNLPTSYGSVTHDNFMEGCWSAGESSELCEQTYSAMSSPGGMPFDQFKTIDSELHKDPTEIPPELQTFLDTLVTTATTGAGPTP